MHAIQTGSRSEITINGGTVNAFGGRDGAGVGGGYGDSLSNITITGGTVTATSEKDGEGIGGGLDSQSGDIIIDGGSIKASSIGSTPKNSKGDEVYLAKIDNQDGSSFIEIDNMGIKIEGNHPNDASLYLYLSGEDHNLNYVKDNKDYIRIMDWSETDKTFSIVKLNPITPDLEIEILTSTSITIKALANTDAFGKAQYSLDGTTWQDNNEFTGLQGNKEYALFAKYIGNNNYNESVPKQITVKTLKPNDQTKPVITPEVKPVETPIVTLKPQKVIMKPVPVVSEIPGIEETIEPETSVKPEVTPTMNPSVTAPPKTQDTTSMNVWSVVIPVIGIVLLGCLAFIISKKRKK